jgi:hypothetical protein
LIEAALEEPDNPGPGQDVRRDAGPARGREQQVGALQPVGNPLEHGFGGDDPGPGFLTPEDVEEGRVFRARPQQVGQEPEASGDLVGPGFAALLLLDLFQGLELVGGFVPPGFGGLEVGLGLGDRSHDARRRPLELLDTGRGGVSGRGSGRDLAFGRLGPGGGVGEKFRLGRALGREFLLLAGQELELLVGPGAFVPGLREALERSEVGRAQVLDLLLTRGALLPGRVQDILPAGRLGPAAFVLRGDRVQPLPGFLDLPREMQDILEELVAVGLEAFLPLVEELDPLGFPLDLALEPGQVGFQPVEFFPAFLERFFQVPELVPPGDGFLLRGLDAGADVLLQAQAAFVEARGLLLGPLEGGEFPPVMVGREFADALPEPAVAVGRLGLALEGVLGLFDLGDDVLEAGQVDLGVFELGLGLALLVLVVSRARRLLDEGPFLGRLGGDEIADGPLLDDEVFLFADGVLPELVLDVLEADGLAVQAVFAFAGPEDPVGDDHFLLVAAQGEKDVGHVERGLLGVAVEDDVLGPVAPDGLDPQTAQDPQHGVDQVALAGAVGADDGREAGMEDDLGSFGEGLESLEFEFLDDHAHCSRSPSGENPQPPGRGGWVCGPRQMGILDDSRPNAKRHFRAALRQGFSPAKASGIMSPTRPS